MKVDSGWPWVCALFDTERANVVGGGGTEGGIGDLEPAVITVTSGGGTGRGRVLLRVSVPVPLITWPGTMCPVGLMDG